MSKRPREDGYAWVSRLCSCGVTERDHGNAPKWCAGFMHSGEWYSEETNQTLIAKDDEATFPRLIKTHDEAIRNLAQRITDLERKEKELDLRTMPLMKVGGPLL